jgi:hypothetical protein
VFTTTVAGWLFAAVALDLLVTRVVVRLAIFVPKGEPWASASAALGRAGAVTDALVPIVAIVLLGALALDAGRGSRIDRLLVAGTAVVAATGLALVVATPAPPVAALTDALIAAVALVAVAAWRPSAAVPVAARVGVWLLALALAAAALGRWTAAGPVLVGLGHAGFVGGAMLLGIAGLSTAVTGGWRRRDRAAVVAGLVIAATVLASDARASEHAGQLVIWSVGLAGVLPIAVVALAAGLAVAGLPALHRRTAHVAVGASIILLAGYGLAASGLVVAGLLGLLVARRDATSATDRRPS